MVLNNYWKALEILKANSDDSKTGTNDDFNMVDIEGGSPSVRWKFIDQYSKKSVVSNINLKDKLIGARVGKGDGTITATDYALFDDCTDDLSDVTIVTSASPTDGGYQNIVTVTGSNNTENAITITEIGITKTFFIQNDSDEFTNPVMFAKILLFNPVTVVANGTFSITVEWLEG